MEQEVPPEARHLDNTPWATVPGHRSLLNGEGPPCPSPTQRKLFESHSERCPGATWRPRKASWRRRLGRERRGHCREAAACAQARGGADAPRAHGHVPLSKRFLRTDRVPGGSGGGHVSKRPPQLFTTSLPQKRDHWLLAPHAPSLLTAVACRPGLLQLLGLGSGLEGHSCPGTRLGRSHSSGLQTSSRTSQPPSPR